MYRIRFIATTRFSAVLWISLSACLSAPEPTRKSTFQEVIVRADQLAATPEGKAFEKAAARYMPILTGALMECAPRQPHTKVSSDFVFVISEGGW
jgi:hypothetical protein